jgi:hypothetical protein
MKSASPAALHESQAERARLQREIKALECLFSSEATCCCHGSLKMCFPREIQISRQSVSCLTPFLAFVHATFLAKRKKNTRSLFLSFFLSRAHTHKHTRTRAAARALEWNKCCSIWDTHTQSARQPRQAQLENLTGLSLSLTRSHNGYSRRRIFARGTNPLVKNQGCATVRLLHTK